jgi:ATP-dependent protease ClpP protease subunit
MKKINTDLPEYIFPFTVSALIDKINEFSEESEISWNSWGGGTGAGQTFIDFLNTKEIKLTANVSGYAASMGAVILPFFDRVIGSKQSDIMIHSVGGGIKSTRRHTNEFLLEALRKKVDEKKFKEVTGLELERVMLAEEDERIDVWLTGEKAGYIGFFDETYDLLEDKAALLKGKVDLKELKYDLPQNIAEKYGYQIKIKNDMEIKDVTKVALKSGNSTVYDEIYDEGKKAEANRVKEIMKYAEFDMDKANEIIESGKEMTKDDVAYFIEKKFNKETIEDLEENSEGELKSSKKTKVTPEKKAEQEKAAAIGDLNDQIGLGEFNEKK